MLTRWDPFREMVSMRKAMDRLIDNAYGEEWSQETAWGLPLDLVEEEDHFLVKASVPGIKPDELEITFNRGMLSIKGEIKDESETSRGKYHLRERRYGTFTRAISLPVSVKSDEIEAHYEEGILTLRLPKSEEVKPKRIPIRTTGEHKVFDAKASRN